ncbi:MAG: DNA/RNA nuclease SfsA [Myxococcales bacterium]|nr:DNA/RNA nuclease SfsA [Myxococcales bacterium]
MHLDFPLPILEGRLIRRYKRFFADIELLSGEIITAHCPNTGSMLSCSTAQSPVLVSHHESPTRKLKYTWEAVQVCDGWVGVNTMRTNSLVVRAIQLNDFPTFETYHTIRTEVPYGNLRSRIDVLLSGPDVPDCYIEIKNATLAYGEIAAFPDAVTTRGQKHLHELIAMVGQGFRAVMVYVVQRSECKRFQPADTIDPTYGTLLREANKAGVEMIAIQTQVTYQGMNLLNPIPVEL